MRNDPAGHQAVRPPHPGVPAAAAGPVPGETPADVCVSALPACSNAEREHSTKVPVASTIAGPLVPPVCRMQGGYARCRHVARQACPADVLRGTPPAGATVDRNLCRGLPHRSQSRPGSERPHQIIRPLRTHHRTKTLADRPLTGPRRRIVSRQVMAAQDTGTAAASISCPGAARTAVRCWQQRACQILTWQHRALLRTRWRACRRPQQTVPSERTRRCSGAFHQVHIETRCLTAVFCGKGHRIHLELRLRWWYMGGVLPQLRDVGAPFLLLET